ncbi:Multidrug resistance outer membrane protein MdtP precursor [Pseudomonas aeruginosa]|nr:Multidrug resistance outer membrane protein MdtP precursor [Pseudomonas aeruginosa]EZN67185.1 outer membrane protein [Pseudomonas aeruginosa BWH032]MDA1395845.1 Solvent efflux pump outer membrane protein SrpC [Pseudomonas aeruginosa]
MPRALRKELTLVGSFVGFLVVFSAISGCVSTGDIAPEAATLDANALATDHAIQAAAREAGWPQAQWWKVYADPQLDAWIEKALDGNPGLAVAHARVRQAKSMAGLVESIESPQIEGKGSLVRHRWPDDYFYGPGDLARTTSWNNSTEIGLNYKLDLWGRDRSDSERAVDLAHMAAAEARQAQLELEGNIVRAYVQLSLQYTEMDIAKAMLQQQRDILALAQRRLRGGIGTHFEVSQAEVPLPETERRIEVIDEEIQLTRNLLAALAGKGPGEGRTIRRPSLNLAAQPSLPSALPAELLGRRPDVVARRWQVAALAKGVDVARADFYPNVDLMASVGFSAVGGGMLEFFRSAKYTYSAGPAVTLPIFDGGRLRSQLGEAAAGYDAAVEQYNQTLVDALKNISDQLIRLHSVDIQKDFAAQSVASAQKTYDIATLAYQRGLTDYLNVLNAQTRLFQQQLVQEQVQAARLAAHASLLTALGGGVGAGADTPAQRKLAPENVPVRAVSSR